MSFAYMRLYTGDYLKDTRHLTPMRHGVYLMMLMHCWDQKGPLPLDRDELAGICNARSGEEMAAIDYVLGRYFIKADDGYYNKRMDGEIAEANVYAEKQREKGRKGGLSRGKQASAKQRLSNGQATAKQKLSPSPSTSPSTSTLTPASTSTSEGKTISPAASAVLVELPLIDGSNYPVTQEYAESLMPACPALDVRVELHKMRNWLDANEKNRKTAKGIKKFIVGWLDRGQNSARPQSGGGKPASGQPGIDAWLKKMQQQGGVIDMESK